MFSIFTKHVDPHERKLKHRERNCHFESKGRTRTNIFHKNLRAARTCRLPSNEIDYVTEFFGFACNPLVFSCRLARSNLHSELREVNSQSRFDVILLS